MEYVNITELKNKFLTYYKSFNKFASLTQDDLNAIKNDVRVLTEEMKGYERYVRTMQYYVHPLRRNFDETVAGLIIACDPFMESLEIYEKHGKPDKNDKDAMEAYANEVRNAIGFYDSNLRIFEKYYRARMQQITMQEAMVNFQNKKKEKTNSGK